jgi:hypothetical protein
MSTIRALTVRQPWAWAIIHGGKDVENRTRNIAGSYRGPVAIHAGLTMDAAAIVDPGPILAAASCAADDRDRFPWYEGRGAIIGVVDLVNVHWDGDLEGGCHRPDSSWECSDWALLGHHHLVLANPCPLPRPIPYRGRLGLWSLPADVLGGAL